LVFSEQLDELMKKRTKPTFGPVARLEAFRLVVYMKILNHGAF